MADLNAIKAVRCDIQYYSGDVRSLTFAVTDENDAAVDLSAKSLVFTIKKRKSGEVVGSLTSAAGITVAGASDNEVTLALSFDLEEMDYRHDLYILTEDTIIYGKFEVTEKVHE